MSAAAKAWAMFALLALLTATIDLVSKEVLFAWLGMPGQKAGIDIVPGVLSLETNLNEGALFGLGQGMGVVFASISVIAIFGILLMMSRTSTQLDGRLVGALGLISGGIIGNLYDRLGLPGLLWDAPPARAGSPVIAVRDWIHFRLEGIIDWPVFNLADTWLVLGATALLWISMRPPRLTSEPPASGPPASGGECVDGPTAAASAPPRPTTAVPGVRP